MADRPFKCVFRNPRRRVSRILAPPIGALDFLALGTKLGEIGQAEGSTLARGSAA